MSPPSTPPKTGRAARGTSAGSGGGAGPPIVASHFRLRSTYGVRSEMRSSAASPGSYPSAASQTVVSPTRPTEPAVAEAQEVEGNRLAVDCDLGRHPRTLIRRFRLVTEAQVLERFPGGLPVGARTTKR